MMETVEDLAASWSNSRMRSCPMRARTEHAGSWSELVPCFMVIGVPLLMGTVSIPFVQRAVGMSATPMRWVAQTKEE